jgi:hypothetical protein
MSPTVPQMKVKAQSLHCPNCGGPVELRGFSYSLTAVCQQCLSVLDASTPALKVLQHMKEKMRRTPKIPLGSRGKFGDTLYEATGFQTRAIEVDGTSYEWDEYVLFNPYKGFLYLTEYQGHWNVVRPLRSVPQVVRSGRAVAKLGGLTYKHFQHANARTVFVLGEFPWRVKVGETVTTDDYTAPPHLLSSEGTGNEVTWSLGEYVEGARIWQAFRLKDKPPAAVGAYVNQPNPLEAKARSAWRLCGLALLALAGLAVVMFATARREKVLEERHHFYPGQTGEQSFVTPIFELKGHESNVVVKTHTDAMNNWMFVNYALINSDDGKAYDFGREISYYRDSDGSEGSQDDSVTIPAVPPGKYYLRVEPEGDAKNSPIEYDIIVRRDVPTMLYFVLAGFALLIPPILSGWRSYRFEYTRWQESDYPKVASSSSGDD